MVVRSVALLALGLALLAHDTEAKHARVDYRYFRRLSIDLVGRAPSRAEIAAFEQPAFQLDRWLDEQLASRTYAERVGAIYEELLKLDLPLTTVPFRPPAIMLRYTTIAGPDGPTTLYFREGQHRVTPAIDGKSCFAEAESGLVVPLDGPPTGTARAIDHALLEARTVLVKPWWLYADYRAPGPKDRFTNVPRFGFELEPRLFVEPDGKTPMTAVRVCREEADGPAGCGPGLERCLPTAPNGFVMPWSIPLGVEQPFDAAPRPALLWLRAWWVEEAKHFLRAIFAEDRDVRELLTSTGTQVNGPLAQFYRYFATAGEIGAGAAPEALFDPAAAPALPPYDVEHWQAVADRGPRAAGLLTMPIFLLKYTSGRQRAHAAYSAFTCKDFIAERAELKPSAEPDLMKRPGCATCHRTLDPMAAAFARVQDSAWTYLPGPVATLHGAAADPAAADAGPRALATQLGSSPSFAPCVVRNVAQSLLGRPMTSEDAPWTAALEKTFVDGGYRMRALVRAIVTSRPYRDANDRKLP